MQDYAQPVLRLGGEQLQRYYRLALMVVVLIIAAVLINLNMPLRRGLDLAGGTRVVLQAQPEAWAQVPERERDDKMRAVLHTLRQRIGGFSGVVEPRVSRQGEDRVIIEMPGISDPEVAIETLRSTAALEFYWLKDVKSDRNPYAKWQVADRLDQDEFGDVYYFIGPDGEEVRDPEEIMEKVVNRAENPPILTGADLKPTAGADLSGNRPVIHIEFDDHGTKVFRDFTRRHVGDILAIFFDGRLLTAPKINEPIPSGRAEISGFRDLAEANQKAQFLNAGALPIPLDIEGRDSVEATLGAETVSRAITAGLVGLALVLLFMVIYYRLPGVIASIALGLYALFIMAAFKAVGVTMTLPGIAAFILSIGMAVDANILIFERLKEELRSGKTLRAGIETGFKRAFTAIFDANASTAIVCAILMWFGTGPVQSFAFVLFIGVVISMFTAITVTRTILYLLVNWSWAQKPSLFGLETSWFAAHGRQLNVVGQRKWFFAISGFVVLLGLVFLLTSGLKPGIEFSWGSAMQVEFERPVTASALTQTIRGVGIDSMVQISEGRTAFIRMKQIEQGDPKLAAMREALRADHGDFGKESFSFVGPTISAELVHKAIMSVIIASLLIVLFISGRFAIGGFIHGIKFGVCAVIALLHNAVIMIGGMALLGALRGWEVDALFITAILTIIGYSVNDTIVVFDRIRENTKHRLRGENFEALTNRSILQTFARSINTSLTVLFVLGALIALGGPIIQHFYIMLFVGIVVGTYSSLFIAAPLLVVWEQRTHRGHVPSKQPEDKPLVTGKPTMELDSATEEDGDTPESRTESVDRDQQQIASTAARAKVKPKKKKRRF